MQLRYFRYPHSSPYSRELSGELHGAVNAGFIAAHVQQTEA